MYCNLHTYVLHTYLYMYICMFILCIQTHICIGTAHITHMYIYIYMYVYMFIYIDRDIYMNNILHIHMYVVLCHLFSWHWAIRECWYGNSYKHGMKLKLEGKFLHYSWALDQT